MYGWSATIRRMKVLILCGGKGTRLREETEYKPKPMVTVGDAPILLHIMKIYAHYGFKDFVLCLGYKGDMIKEYFLTLSDYSKDFEYDFANGQVNYLSEQHKVDYKITFVDTGEDTLSGERVLIAASKYVTDDQFMVTYGDGVSNVDIVQLIEFHNRYRDQRPATISGVHPSTKYGLLHFMDDGRVTKFQEKPQLQDYINGGFMVFEKSALEYLRAGEMLEESLARMTEAEKLGVYTHDGFWHSMDTFKDYQDLNAMWKNDPQWKIWD